ncbi:hypothetical protein [uncultured Hyphomicrobium sp.]|uniref:hypothetical protein n=1 Tax=uncultured Hyphomicrobium sp. TaxID=194373 RepID=UPI0025FFF2BB|nr:hypothetical protein [uncultured Hyphomicrobium sp.]
MIKSLTCLSALAASLACATTAFAFETYKVTGIKAGDTLTIREEPDDGGKPADWKELGRIPADASDVLGTGRSKLVGEQRWFEISFRSTRGWVNAKFLEGAEFADLKGATFTCAGAEPFWGVTLGPGEGEYSDPDSQTKLTTDRVQPATARLFPLLYRLTDTNGRKVRATVSQQDWCSDGMSEYDYSFQVLLSNDDDFQQGCCVLNR